MIGDRTPAAICGRRRFFDERDVLEPDRDFFRAAEEAEAVVLRGDALGLEREFEISPIGAIDRDDRRGRGHLPWPRWGPSRLPAVRAPSSRRSRWASADFLKRRRRRARAERPPRGNRRGFWRTNFFIGKMRAGVSAKASPRARIILGSVRRRRCRDRRCRHRCGRTRADRR